MLAVVIDKSISINASPAEVWQVFTNPLVTKALGGEYVSDWKEGSPIGWKGKDGQMYTRGKIVQLEKDKLIKHQLFDMTDPSVLLSVITYRFTEKDGITIIEATEELNYEVNEGQLAEISEGWNYALQAVKQTAESSKDTRA